MQQDIDRDKFSSISGLVRLFGNKVSTDTLRRYLKRYNEFFNIVYVGGVQYIETEPGIKVLGIIHGAIRPGQNRGGHDVLDALKRAGFEPNPIKPESRTSSPVVNGNGSNGTKQIIVRLCDEDRALIRQLIEKNI